MPELLPPRLLVLQVDYRDSAGGHRRTHMAVEATSHAEGHQAAHERFAALGRELTYVCTVAAYPLDYGVEGQGPLAR